MMHIVLVNPEIPQNTGNIARTCAATGAKLHLIEPLGFELSDKYLKRAGLDYWHMVTFEVHESWEAFLTANPGGRLHFAGELLAIPVQVHSRRFDPRPFESGKTDPALPGQLSPREGICLQRRQNRPLPVFLLRLDHPMGHLDPQGLPLLFKERPDALLHPEGIIPGHHRRQRGPPRQALVRLREPS